MKRIAVLFLVLILVLTSCGDSNTLSEYECYDLYIDGKNISGKAYHVEVPERIASDYALLPLCEVLVALGAEVQWKNDSKATIVFGDESYTLNTRKVSFVEDSSDTELMTLAPGQTHIHYVCVDEELFLDNTTVSTIIMFMMGVRLYHDPPPNDHTVCIKSVVVKSGDV